MPQAFPATDLPYVYTKLDGPDQIRVLKLHDRADAVECSIRQICYADGGYQAISYVWGQTDRPFKAIVRDENGNNLGYVPLTANLYSALKDLRAADGIPEKIFWIDQICIEQGAAEKSHQVALMGKIYESASQVIIYAGPASGGIEEEQRGISLLNLIYRHFENSYELFFWRSSVSPIAEDMSEMPMVEGPKELQEDYVTRKFPNGDDERRYLSKGWKWLLEVAHGEWTERLWIVQEQQANPHLAVLRGAQLLPWDVVVMIPILYAFGLLPELYLNRFWLEKHPNASIVPHHLAKALYATWHNRQRRLRGLTSLVKKNLLSNMTWYDRLKCQDQRDRVYAMLAISSDSSKLNILPDYSDKATADSVFWDISVRLLEAATDLDLLIFACRWRDHQDQVNAPSQDSSLSLPHSLPSWVIGPPKLPFPESFVAGTCTTHPSTSLTSQLRFTHGNSVLVLRGRIVDRISVSAPFCLMSATAFMGLFDGPCIRGFCQMLLTWLAVLQYLGINLQNAAGLCRAIVSSPQWTPPSKMGQSATESAACCFYSYYRRLFTKVKENAPLLGLDLTSEIDRCSSIMELAPMLSSLLPLDTHHLDGAISTEEDECYQAIKSFACIDGRSFSATESSRLCNAMNSVYEGDVVAAFQGSERLFVLRPESGRYRLIGDAYVDGLMMGEAYKDCDPSAVDIDIELV